jgi:hypothetical protein
VFLTKRQRNDIFETLTACGLDPRSCQLRSDQVDFFHPDEVDLVHSASQSRFLIWRPEQPRPWLSRLPGLSRLRWIALPHDLYSATGIVGNTNWDRCALVRWPEILGKLGHWADEVDYETNAPDLWAELRQVTHVLTAAQSAEASNTPFTPAEQAEIGRRLDDIKQLVRQQFELTDEQLAAIDQRLDDAEEASKHTDRKTWLYTFYGAVISTAMTDAVPPAVIQTIVTTVLHGIGHLFGIGGLPPVITT